MQYFHLNLLYAFKSFIFFFFLCALFSTQNEKHIGIREEMLTHFASPVSCYPCNYFQHPSLSHSCLLIKSLPPLTTLPLILPQTRPDGSVLKLISLTSWYSCQICAGGNIMCSLCLLFLLMFFCFNWCVIVCELVIYETVMPGFVA